jgi:hypothetical protein
MGGGTNGLFDPTAAAGVGGLTDMLVIAIPSRKKYNDSKINNVKL